MIRQHYIFKGEVQGVGFRYTAQYLAQSLGLTGWVKNNWDDSVEMEVQGAATETEMKEAKLHMEDALILLRLHVLHYRTLAP